MVTLKKKSSKRSKDKIDRLSNLPEPLISQILSLLPTKMAITTSVLSKRWKYLWTYITSLNFDEKTIYSRQKMKRTKFAVFINWVFIRIAPLHIQKFHLSCSDNLFDPIHLHLWITLIAPTVRKLDLHLPPFRAVDFPINHFRLSKLVVLNLQGMAFKIPPQISACFPNLRNLRLSYTKFSIATNSSLSFPNLTVLHFHNVDYSDKESVHKLFSSCPVLQYLDISIRHLHWTDLPCIIICIPSLARLKINISGNGNCDCQIQIHQLCKLMFLSISGRALKVNGTVFTTISSGFHDLKRLALEVDDCHKLSILINHLLERMDNLEHLVMERKYLACNCHQKSRWTEPLNVPECLLLRVTSMSFTGMMGDCNDELELIRYLLKNAKVVQLLKFGILEIKNGFIQKISCSYTSDRKREMIKKISAFPKGSQSCKIEWT